MGKNAKPYDANRNDYVTLLYFRQQQVEIKAVSKLSTPIKWIDNFDLIQTVYSEMNLCQCSVAPTNWVKT